MIRRLALCLTVLTLAACATEQRAPQVMEEPVMNAPSLEVAPTRECNPGDDDGIGGTGCERLE